MEVDSEMLRLYNPPILPDLCSINSNTSGHCGEGLLSLLYFVCLPLVVMAICGALLVAAMCCSRKACKCKKYSSLTTETNDFELESYNTIRRASISLRQMSQNRETSLIGSRVNSSTTLDRSYEPRTRRGRRGRDACNSAPGTLQRQHRHRHTMTDDQIPYPHSPAYSIPLDDVFVSSEFGAMSPEMQTSVVSEGNQDFNRHGVPVPMNRQFYM